MTHLGSFGAAVRELDPDAEPDTFEFLDQTFTVHGVIPPILTWQLSNSIAGNGTTSSFRAALFGALHAALTKPPAQEGEPADQSEFERFYLLATRRKATEDSLHDLVNKLFEVQAGRPTGEPHGSSPGPSETGPSSNGSSSTPPDSPTEAGPGAGQLRPISDLLQGQQPG